MATQNTWVYLVDLPERRADGTFIPQPTILADFRAEILALDPTAEAFSIQEKLILYSPLVSLTSRATRVEVRFVGGNNQDGKIRNAIDALRAAHTMQAVRWGRTERVEEIRV